MKTAKIGLIGLAVMGENLALNFERNGFPVAVWNREYGKLESFLRKNVECDWLLYNATAC